MGKFRKGIEVLGLGASLIAGEGAMSAQKANERPATVQSGSERAGVFNASGELNKLIARYANKKTGGADLEALKGDEARYRRLIDADRKEGASDSLITAESEAAEILELKYQVLKQLQQEVSLWGRLTKFPGNAEIQSQLFEVGNELRLAFVSINSKINRAATDRRLSGGRELQDLSDQEVEVRLPDFASDVKAFVKTLRANYQGAGISLPDLDPNLAERPKF